MALFQNSVLRNHLEHTDLKSVTLAYENYEKYFLSKVDNIKSSKEEQYQYGFLEDIFVKALGYTLNPAENFNLTTEFKNQSDSKKADGAILKNGKVIAVIELKSTKTKSMDSIVNQAFNYKNNHPYCRYIITSNFQKLRLYIDHSDSFEEFDLFDLDFERFTLFYHLLNRENLFADIPIKLKEQSKLKELKKKKVTLTLVEQDEWEEYFESYQKELLDIKVEIDKTDKDIDEIVYELYGLNEEETAVVESN